MPRPCQKRRTSAAANRKQKPAAPPPPIRHKARQKAIHNARRGRGGRSHTNGGRSSRNQKSGREMEQDFISFASRGNNFQVLNDARNHNDSISMDDIVGSGMEEGELITDDGSDSDIMDELDMYDTEDMMINVEVDQALTGKGLIRQAEVMFTIPAAISIYHGLWQTGFPLLQGRVERYRPFEANTSPESASYVSFGESLTSQHPSLSSATSNESNIELATHSASARDYVFDWGKYSGKRFLDVPESYLRTIGGQLNIYEVKHRGLREAFEYHRPGRGRAAPAAQAEDRLNPKEVRQSAPKPRPGSLRNNQTPSEVYRFNKGSHKGKRLHEVPENYLRTLEGMKDVVDKWPGLKEALQDFNEKTGRRGRG